MNWEQIVGQEKLKNLLIESIEDKRVGHAQLFVGKAGYGTLPLAMAFAKEIFRRENEQSSSKVEHLNHLDLHISFPVFKEKKQRTYRSVPAKFSGNDPRTSVCQR